MWLPTIIGTFTIIMWIKPAKDGTDASNIINRIRLWWFALTRQAMFVSVCPWLKNDELENVSNTQEHPRQQ